MFVFSLSSFLAFLNTAVFMVGYITNNSLFPEPLSRGRRKNIFKKV